MKYLFIILFAGLFSAVTVSAKSSLPNGPSDSSNIVVLQYHHIDSTTPPSTSVNLETFISHLELLEQYGFKVLPLSEIINKLNKKIDLPKRTAAITFDDGYRNIYLNGFPELKKRNWPFTVFVSPNAHEKTNGSFLSIDEMKEMIRFGGEFANHSWNHDYLVRKLPNETQQQWSKRVRENLADTESWLIKHFGGSNRMFAYPYGEFNLELLSIVKELNLIGIGQHSGPLGSHSDFTALPRFPASGIYSNIETLKTKLLTQAFPDIQIKNRKIITTDSRPSIEFSIPLSIFNGKQVNCFASGAGAMDVVNFKNNDVRKFFRITPKKDLKPGRNRYNCTLKVAGSQDHYWHSFPWIIEEE